MTDAQAFIDQTPVQDRDLLQRLSLYLDTIDSRLRQGQGWFIFNADPPRSGRVSRYLQQRLGDVRPPVEMVIMPWRDFSLNAYVMEVGLPQLEPVAKAENETGRSRREYDFAQKVTGEVWEMLRESDLLVVAGVHPRHLHELVLLERAIDQRTSHKRATILMAPGMPHEVEAELAPQAAGKVLWERVFSRMYETSLVAL